MSYRAYITVHGDNGKRLGKTGLAPVVANLQAHSDEAFTALAAQGYRLGYARISPRSRQGKTVVYLEADEAWEVRVAYKAVRTFLQATGWRYAVDLNANTRRAL